MKTYDELWKYIADRSGSKIVQDYNELKYIYDLMIECECERYLEIGTAEGNSLYVLGHAVKDGGTINWIDWGEKHTEEPRILAEIAVKSKNGSATRVNMGGIIGDSTHKSSYKAFNKTKGWDCVLIDGGHDYTTVLSDAILYAPLATKYVFFHDIQLPEVKAAVDWFVPRWDLGEYSEFINSKSYGYGIIKVRQ